MAKPLQDFDIFHFPTTRKAFIWKSNQEKGKNEGTQVRYDFWVFDLEGSSRWTRGKLVPGGVLRKGL